MEKMDLESKYEPMPSPASGRIQTMAALGARLVSLASLILLFVWMYQHLGGLGWYGKKNFFNAHPFFMVLGIAFFLTNGVLSWRDVPFSHGVTKLLHVAFNALALGCIGVGLYVTIASNSSPHMSAAAADGLSVSLHSWVGLVSVAMITLQVVGGLLFYLVPIFPFAIRARVLPLHAWLGAVGYTMLMMTIVIGMVEWMALKTQGKRSAYTNTPIVLGNVLGLLVFVTLLSALWSLLPRRNIAVDVEERDGVSITDPSRSRLKGEAYATPTSGGRFYSTSANPFGAGHTSPLPPRRGHIPETTY